MPFTSFLPAISPEALKARSDRLRDLRIHRRTDLTLDDLAEWLNPIIAGWMHYYGRYYRTVLHPLLRRVNIYMRRWGWEEASTVADLQAAQAVVGRATRKRARSVRPVAVG
ncbi:MAG: group II intron maturase-specific domain-containing protein, partial [Mycobacteriaceae bacterium]